MAGNKGIRNKCFLNKSGEIVKLQAANCNVKEETSKVTARTRFEERITGQCYRGPHPALTRLSEAAVLPIGSNSSLCR